MGRSKLLRSALYSVVVLLLALLPATNLARARAPESPAAFIPRDPDFPIADSSTLEEMHPAVAYSYEAPSEYLVVYESEFNAGDRDIAARVVSSNGDSVGDPFYIATSFSDERYPAVARDIYGSGYLVVWQVYSATSGWNIMGKIVDPPGAGLSFLIAGAAQDQLYPDVSYAAAADQYLVVWEDWDASLANPSNIRGTCVTDMGALIGSTLDIGTAVNAQYRPAVSSSDFDDPWLVVWEHYYSATDHDIRAQAVDAAGGCHLHGSELTVSSEVGLASPPDVSWGYDDPYAAGRFFVTWAENNRVQGQQVDAGTLALTGSRIAVSDAASNKYAPALAWSDSEGGWWVVWPDNRSSAFLTGAATLGGEPTFIFGERVRYDGSVTGRSLNERVSLEPPSLPPSNSQMEVAIAFSPVGRSSLVAWQDHGHLATTPPYFGIWGRIWAPTKVLFVPLALRGP